MQRRKKLLLAVWVVGFLSINTSTLLNLVAKPEIEKPEQLRGKNIGISRYGTSLHTGARIAMKHFGLEPGKDVAIVEIGSGDWIVGALQGGRVQAAVFGYPATAGQVSLGTACYCICRPSISLTRPPVFLPGETSSVMIRIW